MSIAVAAPQQDIDAGIPVTVTGTVIIKRDLKSWSINAELIIRGTRGHTAFAVSRGGR
jgi:hypothetical protein